MIDGLDRSSAQPCQLSLKELGRFDTQQMTMGGHIPVDQADPGSRSDAVLNIRLLTRARLQPGTRGETTPRFGSGFCGGAENRYCGPERAVR
jgi:hypothetical protein